MTYLKNRQLQLSIKKECISDGVDANSNHKQKPIKLIKQFSTILLFYFLVTLLAFFGTEAVNAQNKINVGGKNFTEQQILASMTGYYLEKNGYEVAVNSGMGTSVLRAALENKQIDLYWSYTGTALSVFYKISAGGLSTQSAYKKIKDLDIQKGIVWLNPSLANNTYALAIRKETSQKLGLETISELGKIYKKNPLKLAVNAEFYAREDGLKPLLETYGFSIPRKNIVRMDTGLVYQALRDKQVEIGLVFATDGRIKAFDFTLLKDDKSFLPNYAIVPVIRKEVLDKNPKIAQLMNALSAKITDATMSELNAKVDVDKQTIEQVSIDFLKQNKLLP